MRETIFNAIISKLETLAVLKGSDGTSRVYKFPVSEPAGYPAVSVASLRTESAVLDNQRDARTYVFNVRVIQEKMAEGFGPEKAEKTAREREDEILALFDGDNNLGVGGVTRTTPLQVEWGYIDDNTRLVFDITLAVEACVDITF